MKGIDSIIGIKPSKKEDAYEDDEKEISEASLDTAAEEILAAVEAGDSESLKSALRVFVTQCKE